MVMRKHCTLPAFFFLVIFFGLPVWGLNGSLVLVGGGNHDFMPNSWSEATFKHFIEKSNNGNILILSCTDETDSLANYLVHLGANSASLLKIPHRPLADSPESYKAIERADGLFVVERGIRDIIGFWGQTRTETGLREFFASGKPLGGTGTDGHIFAEIKAFRASGELSPPQAIRGPSALPFTFQSDFLPLLHGVILESHFTRNGGLPVLLIKMAQWRSGNPGKEILGIGIDERTALIVEDNLNATVLGEGSVTFLSGTASSVIRLDSRLPPVFTDVSCDILTEGFVYNISERRIISVPNSALPGTSYPAGLVFRPVLIDGSNDQTTAAGEVEIFNHDRDSLALQLGLIDERPGESKVPAAIIMPLGFSHPDYYENRVGGLLWGLAKNPRNIGILLDKGGKADITVDGTLVPHPMTDQPATLILDTRNLQWRDFSHWISFPDSKGLRGSVALAGLKIHLIATRCSFKLPTGEILFSP